MKEPKCKICGGKHYKFQCWQAPRKPIQTKSPLEANSKCLKSKKASKTTKISKPSDSARKRLVKQLDEKFSKIVRQKGMNNAGENWCYTCGVRKNWKELDCGHFHSRRFTPTRWDLDNMRPQCVFCNRNLGGNLEIYERKLKKELGEAKFEELFKKSRSNIKISTPELEEKLKKS